MLDENKIRQIAQEVATATLSTANFSSILSGPAVDSEGHDALRITIVIKPAAVEKPKPVVIEPPKAPAPAAAAAGGGTVSQSDIDALFA